MGWRLDTLRSAFSPAFIAHWVVLLALAVAVLALSVPAVAQTTVAAVLLGQTVVIGVVAAHDTRATRNQRVDGAATALHAVDQAELAALRARLQVTSTDLTALGEANASFGGEATEALGSAEFSSTHLRSTADEVSRAALRIMSEAVAISVAADDTNRKVADMVTAGQEFLHTIARIGDHASRSALTGGEAVAGMDVASATIDEMNAMSDQIGALTSLVAGIANQTNLLALNATIEAARAGTQGKGFAVVAAEVKLLATETSRAVSTISETVLKIRGAAERSVTALGSVAQTISVLNQSTAAIAASVEDRVAAAKTMAASTGKAADNIAFLTAAIRTIESVADEAAQGAGALCATADDLTGQIASIRGRVSAFVGAAA